VLQAWLQRRLAACGADLAGMEFAGQNGAAGRLGVDFCYKDAGRSFKWSGNLADGHARFEADYGAGRVILPASVSLLPPEGALSEAMFF